MSDLLKMKIKGLYTHPSDLDAVPEGALAVADNVVIDKEGKVQPRRGFDKHSTLTLTTDRSTKMFSYQDKLITAFTGGKLAYYDSGWNNYTGTFNAPTDEKIRDTKANSNFYFTTSNGIQKLDAYNATPTDTGAPRALDTIAALTTATGGFVTADSQVAYRVVWGFKDANENLILGSPSNRIYVSNPSGAPNSHDVDLTITIPIDITTNWFFQVYRSALSTSATAEPSDELGLVYEANPTAGEITAASLTFVDKTPESLVGADLYTNDSQEGLLQSNTQPPKALDIATFKNVTFYANTTSKHRIFLDILASGPTSGIQINDVLTIAGVTYTGKATEVIANREFKIFTGGTPSQNVADTTKSLIRVINQSTTTTDIYAHYLSGVDDLPGKILLEERDIGGVAFTVQASLNGDTAYNPSINTAYSSTNDRYLNGLFFSKTKQPEAVPLLNFQQVGSASDPIIRIAALRDSLFIIKTDGIFRLTGESPETFVIDEFDSSTKILAPESIQVLNNQVFCLADQGVVNVSESGVQVISRPIEKTLLELMGANLEDIKAETFAVSYESDRKYILSVVSSSADTFPTQSFVWNTFTSSWTRWNIARTSGIVNPVDDKLYMTDTLSNKIFEERKDFSYTDFTDEADDITITSYTDKTINVNTTVGIDVGDVLYESSSKFSIILTIESATQLTVADTVTWTVTTISYLKSFECLVEWVPVTGGNAGILKHFQEMAALFDIAYFRKANLRFYSDISGSLDTIELSGNYGSGWGLFQWGGIPWGGASFKAKPIRTYIPRNKQKCSQLSVQFQIRQAYAHFEIQGFNLMTRAISNRIMK